MSRRIFIGDVHGCAQELRDLVTLLQINARNDRIFLTGDAFTKGPDPLGVWHIIRELEAQMVLGNHDVSLYEGLNIRAKGKEKKIKPAYKKTLDAVMPVAKELMAWIDALPLYIQTESFLLVHAGINPERGLEGTSRDEFLTIRAWPPKKGIGGKRWYRKYKPIAPLLVFGHDAPGGLVMKKKDGDLYLLGLDTGCVYGRKLSAYVLEERQLVQVNSQQPKQFED